MKLTKKLEAEILKAYDTYWDAYLKGDIKTFASFLDDDITIFGTAISEVFNTKKEAIRFYKATADQLTGKAQFRNRQINVQPVDDTVVLNDQNDFYILIGKKWTFYGHARITAIFKETREGWKLVHQHASFPDTRAEEGEQVAAEKIKKENLELRDAVKRRTIELEEKNRELEIETSLERVRSVAMSMRKPDDLLNVAKTQFKELKKLGFTEIRNALIGIFYDDKNYFIDYDFSDFSGGAITQIPYHKNKIVDKAIKRMKSANDAFTEFVVKGKELQEWKDFRKQNGEYDDTRLKKIDKLYYYFYSIDAGNIGISTFKKISDEQLTILRRFRNVFDLAYRRYVDITKAEAQTYEARIEASLEKVRAQALAMHKADDLLNVCESLFKELQQLGFNQLRNAIIHTFNDEKGYFRDHDYSDSIGGAITIIPYSDQYIVKTFLKEIRKSDNAFFQFAISGKSLKEWKEFRKKGGQPDDPRIKKATTLYYYVYSVGLASIGISTFEAVDEEKQKVLKRFRNVFDFAYRRYMDVAMAEAQAKEARIETALERVRAVAMAMKRSEELVSVSEVIYNELVSLGFTNIRNAQIAIENEEKESFRTYVHSDTEKQKIAEAPYSSSPLLLKAKQQLSTTGAFYQAEYTGKELDDWRTWRKSRGRALDKRELSATSLRWYLYATGKGHMGISTFNEISTEQIEIVKRFKNVFELSYQRFDDLQKAEAQAREARIELALERTRTQSMLMQHSKELDDTLRVFHEQVLLLGISSEFSYLWLPDEDKDRHIFWAVWAENLPTDQPDKNSSRVFKSKALNYPLDRNEPATAKCLVDWKSDEPVHSYYLPPDEVENYFDNWKELLAGVERLKPKNFSGGIHYVEAFMKYGCFGVMIENELSEEEKKILYRFSIEFERTYTRFLDLQKAEAQAREAQIEAALEKVRSRTMAMQKSDELGDVATVLFKQLNSLVKDLWTCGFVLCEKDKAEDEWWLSTESGFIPAFYLPNEGDATHYNIYQGWLNGEEYHTEQLEGEALQEHYDWLMSIPIAKKIFDDFASAGYERPKWQKLHCAYFSKGYLCIITQVPCPDEIIFRRFAQVFDLTYTRFLDLKKAEAQARESQIQLALERVRARTMAMHKSDELADVAGLLFKQVTDLGIKTWTTGFNVWSDDNNSHTDFITSPLGGFIEPYTINASEYSVFTAVSEAKKRGEGFYIHYEEGEKLRETYRQLSKFGETQFKKMLEEGFQFPAHQFEHFVFGSKVSLMFITYEPVPEAHDIFKRFGKVFEQTYTRFLDLQKAEAQARESQIQLALERVRARTMAMQQSDELPDTSYLVFQQFEALGTRAEHFSIGIINEEEEVGEMYATVHGDKLLKKRKISIHEPIAFKKVYTAWKEKKKNLVLEITGEELKTYNIYRNKIIGHKAFSENIEPGDRWIILCAFFSKGLLSFASSTQPPGEILSLLERFARVFDGTYTRFLDLQKAEAQAREAQIETALEKVRSRSLAMHKSGELNEVVMVLFERLKDLQIPVTAVGIHIFSGGSKDLNVYVCGDIGNGLAINNYLLPYFNHPIADDLYNAHGKGLDFFVGNYSKQQKNSFYKHLFEHSALRDLPDDIKNMIFQSESYSITMAPVKNSVITVNDFEGKPLSDAEADVVKRFAKVFEQAYIRFLDLQKAEAQAREAQIEAALERVRSRSMGMQKSEELKEVIQIVYDQLVHLNINTEHTGFVIDYKVRDDRVIWVASKYGVPSQLTIPYFDSVYYNSFNEAKEKGWDFFATNLSFEEKNVFYKELFTHIPGLPEKDKEFYFNCPGLAISTVLLENIGLYIENFEGIPFSDEDNAILMRFGKVFQQTYTRFLDLQKAEAQAREAQIEAGLERVRARGMAMQTSEELGALIGTLFTELTKLDLVLTRCVIWIIDSKSQNAVWWMANSEDASHPMNYFIPYHEHAPWLAFMQEWKKRTIKWVYDLEGQNKKDWDDYLFSETGLAKMPGFIQDGMRAPDRVLLSVSFNNFGGINVASLELLSDEHFDILLRFAKVFDLTYTRFNDLKQAEAQAREAQIEAALERVRSKTMAMHNSQDVGETVATMFGEFVHLGIHTNRCGILIFDDNNSAEVWTARLNPAGKATLIIGKLDLNIHNMLSSVYVAWKSKVSSYQYDLVNEDLINYYDAINRSAYYPVKFDINALPSREFHSDFFFPEGAVFAFTSGPIAEEHSKIFKRFAGVFGQTYRRYLDLQKAEAQAREATIEAALEKVRGKAMAMHNSNDLSATASMVFSELRKLGINPIRCGFGSLHKESHRAQLYSATSSADGDSLSLVGWVELSGHPVLEKIYDTWLNNEEYYPELIGEQLKSYYELLLSGLSVSVPKDIGQKQYGTFLPFSVGCLYAWSETPYNDSEIKILKRFATIIDLTFRRYLELQKSEANAKEAVKQAALDRIRADIASMRTISDLDRITPLIWNELTILGIPFIRCGVFIMDDSQQLIHTFLSTPDGKAIAAFHLPYDTAGNIENVLNHWKNKQNYIDHWDEKEFYQFAEILEKQGALESAENYLKTIPHGGFFLHFLPFLQGMLYVGNSTQLSEDDIKLIQSVADAFSTAYARYEDFNKLEAAKKQVDSTLNELQATQKQLVQSEKMASLGELTAGIAHEIQNPLNFVNNFSDVSNELIDEMMEEVAKGNIDEAKAIAADVKQNLEKISHHGKRADGIVKGMLQHSRTSSGQKEMTDINALADEYLRLAYHGLRAKDKSFNAKFETHFDNNIDKVNVIPQDIGRVILNLINNAFYAVSERQRAEGLMQNEKKYEPIVMVSTKRSGDKVLVSVKDNGIGIPQRILEKIFQPFFTTKPTGQGTGLGLSLAYDIITKGHNGELKVETQEGEGSRFIIQLPV